MTTRPTTRAGAAPGWRAWLLLVLGLLAPLPRAATAQTSTEAQLKAAFLVNFFKYVEWPRGGSEYRLCLFGRSELWPHLAAYDGRQVAGRSLRVLRLNSPDEVRQCHQVFLPEGETARSADLLSHTEGEAVLTVGEADGFLNAGGAILLSPRNGQMQFDINTKALNLARLKVGSPMLRLARSVKGQER